jgi:REP element-mobilizing transposase RayT
MVGPPAALDGERREAVADAIRSVCEHRNWAVLALNVRSNHVHVVVAAEVAPEKVLVDLKSWSTRRLREVGLAAPDEKLWSRHGSTRWLWSEGDVVGACRYVNEAQG